MLLLLGSGLRPAPLLLFGVLAATGDLDFPWSAGFKMMFLCFVRVTELCVSAEADDGEGAAAPIEVLFFFRTMACRE